jgi:hypothetical protein
MSNVAKTEKQQMEESAVPIKDVLADPNHPAHGATKDMLAKLESGEISLCACMGPGYGEPYCPCEMERRGLPSSPEHIAANEESEKRFAKLFEPGGYFYEREGK